MKVVELSGGVGGARLARGLAKLPDVDLTVIVNVGDDSIVHGLHVSPDIDTVLYTLAATEGPHGWGRAKDTFVFNSELARFGLDNSFALGDLDLALKIARTVWIDEGSTLTECTLRAADSLGVEARVLPPTDQRVSTKVQVDDGWISFRDYFVTRRHRDRVLALDYDGIDHARISNPVRLAIEEADHVIVGPSNPPLSIWPIVDIPGMRSLLEGREITVVSPLIGGEAVKGPVVEIMGSLGLGTGNEAVVNAYRGLATRLVIHESDPAPENAGEIEITKADTLITESPNAELLARSLVFG